MKASTGIEGLDRVLLGGFMEGDTILVEGAPGTGKTTLGIQFIYHGIVEREEPGIIVIFEELPDRIYRDATNFGWDLRRLVEERKLEIIPASPEFSTEEIASAEGLVEERARQMGARRIVVDSITHFRRLTQREAGQRDLFAGFMDTLKWGGLTALVTMEMARGRSEEIPFEEYIVDGVLRLTYEALSPSQRVRYLEVLKARGQNFLKGKHSFSIGAEGIEVFPVETPEVELVGAPQEAALARVTSGIEGVDHMLKGGLMEGFTTMYVGASGSGKTCFALHFVAGAAAKEWHTLFVSIGQHPDKLFKIADSIGINLRMLVSAGWVTLLHVPPVNLEPNELLAKIRRIVDQKEVRRLVVDSVTDIETNVTDPSQFRQYVYLLVDVAHRANATCLLTADIPLREGSAALEESPLAALTDTILGLQGTVVGGQRRNTVDVLKMRGSSHTMESRPFRITSEGITVESRRRTSYSSRPAP